MALENWLVAVAGVCLVSACSGADDHHASSATGTGGSASGSMLPAGSTGGSSETPSSGGATTVVPGGSSGATTSTGGPSPGAGGSSPGAGGSASGAAGNVSTGAGGSVIGPGSGGGPVDPGGTGSFDYNAQTVTLSSDLVIPAGKTVRVGPGVTFNAATKVTVQVQGTLVVTGTAASPSKFMGSATGPNSWNGIVIASGGDLEMQYGTVDGATYGIHAMPGSKYNIDHATLGTSFKTAVLESDGKIDHTHFLATAPPTISLAEDVSIDDPNGTVTILAASPTLTNSEFVGASPLTDLVRIGGNSKPLFDHDLFKNAHCGFHTYGVTDSSAQITNSVISGMSYGVMAFTTKPIFKGDVFQGNANDAGFCYGAMSADAPVFDGSYFASGTAAFDASCVQVMTAATNSVTTMIAGAGPVGL